MRKRFRVGVARIDDGIFKVDKVCNAYQEDLSAL